MTDDGEEFVMLNGEKSSTSSLSAPESRRDSVDSERDEAVENVHEDAPAADAAPISLGSLFDNALPEGPVPAEAPFDWTIRPEQQQFYDEDAKSVAVNNLIMFTIAMFTVPFAVMYVCFYYVFDAYDTKDDMLYSGVVAMASVYAIVGLFIYVAYREERQAELSLQADKKDK